ncbi:hypothetical protein E6P09_16840 (plasmid) [Haloferax mediterranei ATCC 33500]|uniref:Uncharacterized protein n=1 Tax=Haloferax mediterranei (strain ATCC 33500 / DSM 1411 / JCM 8866 / NBRC 14739 / NCIMB 2177 / R-4) TaxID=523841 RepID=I3RAR9_HALMT|nr:hypothetical protein [Haloferax mediterranei]AFK21329.2 hypothetical protein HFX_6206 [Haloferax mediterranei ATCC 33500]AHZ24582.1 hypothetical protein BM92_16920 [Haloferax mediterranei ATCC 33500]ELZ97343.1 hypothetical protein C439_18513 [Haloferax mediterranei ATCC 33500]MDX5990361.1 hypothetical protein [Haloferax mediterranei ATCC 33500]QCQ76980.1 hypothetical protein E6P09_16840 [Haloferax mediterranei ATCC 33500]
MTRDTDEAMDGATGLLATGELGWLPERVELPGDEWVIYPPGEPRPANFALRFEKSTPAVLVGTESGDAPGVHVLPHPGGLSVSARFGGIVDDSVHEFETPQSDDERASVASWVQTWVSRIDERAEKARIQAACAPVPNAGDRAAKVLYEHFGSADSVAAAVVERDTASLRKLSGIAEQTASELVVHYGTDAEWEYYRQNHRDTAP